MDQTIFLIEVAICLSNYKMKLKLILLLFVTNIHINAISTDTLNYLSKPHKQIEGNCQYRERITIFPDSTFKKTLYIGDYTDNSRNYKKWSKEYESGVWKKYGKRSIVLIQGSIRNHYYINNNKLTLKRYQKRGNGYIVRFRRWKFEKYIKYYRLKNSKMTR